MNRRKHIRGQKRIFEAYGIEPPRDILDDVNYSKDLFSNYPRGNDGKRLSPNFHRGHEHGFLTNPKWFLEHGMVGFASSVMHNFQDRCYSGQLTFLRERAYTWYPRKLIDQLIGIPVLKNGVIKYEHRGILRFWRWFENAHEREDTEKD
jgi:hypothetical protein